jgi:hypothetical protein
VKFVDVVEGEGIDKFFDKSGGIEIPGRIQHKTPPWEAGPVPDFGAGDFNLSLSFGGKEKLPQGLEPVVEPPFPGGLKGYGFLAYGKPIGFFPWPFDLFTGDLLCPRRVFAALPGVRPELFSPKGHEVPKNFVPGYAGDSPGTKKTLPVYDRLGRRNDV